MSQVKFDVKETVRQATTAKDGLVQEVGNAITRGTGPGGYLAVCLERASWLSCAAHL